MIGWACYRIVMWWPTPWPAGAIAGWMLAQAGYYADPPGGESVNEITLERCISRWPRQRALLWTVDSRISDLMNYGTGLRRGGHG